MSEAQHSHRYLHASDTAADSDSLSAGTKSSTDKSEQHDADAAHAIPASKLGSVTDRVRNFVSNISNNCIGKSVTAY